MTEKYTHLRGVSVALRGIFCRNARKIIQLMPICALTAQMLVLFRRSFYIPSFVLTISYPCTPMDKPSLGPSYASFHIYSLSKLNLFEASCCHRSAKLIH